MDDAIRKLILSLIEKHSVLTLATLRADGWPQATTLAYASTGTMLFVAAVPEWGELRGLSMAASAEVMASRADIQQAARLLKKKFPALAEYSDLERDGGWVFLRLVPRIVSVIDYAKGFGHTVLVRL